ncbi:glycoside hydrolase family 30 protein [Robiginitalea sediminis]|uniref:glycoside hydrolase family 30 protein n=1 Tax=Robiginitalea sediminis TaxID=1982593 RepID=UPI000B4AC890|nr:glycoside hydrolase family 30 beta sandwich domain-containing protein [Robiginitalea sediminis]
MTFRYFFLLLLGVAAYQAPAEPEGTVVRYRTTLDKQLLLQPDTLTLEAPMAAPQTIVLDTAATYQTMDGFGFTLTGGSALNLQRMSAPARAALLQELFGDGPEDIGISYLRLSVGGSDLDEHPWSYDDLPPGETDPELEHFSLGYDTLYLIPTLKEILAIQPDILLMGSPWSPPAWMKDNGDTRGGSLLPEFYPAYARYFVKYIEGMAAHGIRIDAITVQNEPLHPGNNPSLLMLAEDQADFVKNHLGPAFRQAGIDTKIVVYDHNADKPEYPITILDDPEAAQYIDGSAFHLYGGTIDALSTVHQKHPDKHLYFTEQWIGAPGDFAGDFSWHISQLMIGAPNNWSKIVLQWNLAADENQDPHTDRGGCDRCLGGVTLQGDAVTRNPAYYIVAQNSKFIPRGSVRIGSGQLDGIGNVAYRTPEGHLVALLQNQSEERRQIGVQFGDRAAAMWLEAGEVNTMVWE